MQMDEIIEKLECLEYYDIADELNDLINENMILDLDRFKRELNTQGLMNEELRDFIENYMRFDNRWGRICKRWFVLIKIAELVRTISRIRLYIKSATATRSS